MSFDLFLKNGDLEIGTGGDFTSVTESQKLIQDVLKALHTPVGNDPFNAQYGVTLTARTIGNVGNLAVLTTQMRSDIERIIGMLHNNQQRQFEQGQTLFNSEVIVGLDNLVVEPDVDDPRQINVVMDLRAQDFTVITVKFQIETFLNDPFNPDASRSFS